MNVSDIYKTFIFLNSYDYICNEKVFNYSVQLLTEIMELIESGYSKEKIMELIDNINVSDMEQYELESLKLEGYRMLNIRYKIYMENKKIRKYKRT